ncbi:site-specific DNA-methyltransferase, partial [uncultured Anaerococcus sp.]|uniref:site-specific DNA-methyltransferase n=1 Tax=uncultured Anaerococcus sp. TaxID=293428 RepID=UPI0028056E43
MTIERFDFESRDIAKSNVEKIGELFPGVITEKMDENGVLKRAIDFDKLMAVLRDDVVEKGKERYEFTWPGKRQAMAEANKSINKTLRPVVEESKDWDNTENLYIEGDNLEVLKLLQESYLGKVKMIYIDPPYNTGNDFVYNDSYEIDSERYKDMNDEYSEENEKLLPNPESNGRFHSDWCSMIYPRLKLARNLLTDDGVIFISIDDNEQDNLKKICDEVFGGSNFVANIIWNSRKSVSNDAVVSNNHNHTLVFSKNMKEFYLKKSLFKLPQTEEGFENPDNDSRGPWKADPFDSPGIRPNLTYEIKNPNTGEVFMPPDGRCWRTGPQEYKNLYNDNRIVFGKTGSGKPQLKRFLSEAKNKGITPKSIWDDVGTTTNGTDELTKLFSKKKIFDAPKPVNLIKKIAVLATYKDSLILDFFSGFRVIIV